MLRNRTKHNGITGDIQKAFLQIKVNPEDRDALRLLWYDNLEKRSIVEYRFTRVIFGSSLSPYILGATLQKHVGQYEEKYPKTAEELLQTTYVDHAGEELLTFQQEATQIMAKGGFRLHKWHCNVPEVEKQIQNETEKPQAVSQHVEPVSGDQKHDPKILGIPWDEGKDELSISFVKPGKETGEGPLTKRKMLSAINSIFDLLGIAAPIVVLGKIR